VTDTGDFSGKPRHPSSRIGSLALLSSSHPCHGAAISVMAATADLLQS